VLRCATIVLVMLALLALPASARHCNLGGLGTPFGIRVICQCQGGLMVYAADDASPECQPTFKFERRICPEGSWVVVQDLHRNYFYDSLIGEPIGGYQYRVTVECGPLCTCTGTCVSAETDCTHYRCPPMGRCCYPAPSYDNCAIESEAGCDSLTGKWEQCVDCGSPCSY
jgi:hypothetical protein